MAKKGLGKGLGAIFGEDVVKENKEETEKKAKAKAEAKAAEEMDEKGRILMLKLDLVQPNKEQPRKTFDEEKINELAESIKNYGVLQPLLVQKNDSFYEIIAGERRWRAAKAAGLKEVPAVLKEYSKQEAMEISLIENVQRADLNPIEEALGYRQLIDEFGLTQEEIAVRVAKSRTAITNTMRLLKLDEQIQNMLVQGVITSGHARALLSLEDTQMQLKAAKEILDKKLSVRETERLVKRLQKEASGEKKEEKKTETALVNSGTTVITPKTQVTVETPKTSATPVAATESASAAYREVSPDAIPSDAIQTGNGKLVIVIGEEPFNMTMMTANAGGSLGKIAGNKAVVFTILSPDQPYGQMDAAQNYTVRFYPNGQNEPSIILECKKFPSQAPIEGMPRTYIGEILKAKIK